MANSNPEKDGLPSEAFAIVGDPRDTSSWKLPHHTRAIWRFLKGRIKDLDDTVDCDRMPSAVAALSPGGHRGQRVEAGAGQLLAAARHLAGHYREAGRPIPNTLAAII